MPYFWDFRTILDVDPKNDRTCVGTTQKGSGCKNPINMADRDTAGRLLDQMDRFKSLKSSFDHLETLAALLLCKHKHNNHKSFAHLSQVDEVTSRWIKIVEEEYRIVRKQKEKEKALKAKQELLRVSESARQMKAELEEEKAVRVPPKLSRNEPSSHHEPFRTTTTGLYDPFVTATSSLKANNTLPKQSKIHLGEAAKATEFTNTASKSHTSVKVEEVEIGTYDSPPSRKADTGLPTPETTPQDSRSNLRHHINQEYTPTPAQMKQREDPTQTLTPPSSIKVTRKTTEFTFEYGPGLGIQDGSKTKLEGLKAATEQIWSFPGFNEAKEQANKSSSSSSSQKQLPPSPALEVEVPVARVPLGVKSTSTHNNMKTGKPKIGYEFGNQEDMPFKGFNFGSNIPRLAALEAPKKARTSPPAHFISLGEPSQDISSTSERKYTQDQLETRIASMSLGNSKSDIVLMSQVTSKSQLNSMSEPIPEPQRMSDIRNAPVSDKTIDIHLDTDNDSTTDIEATTPSTIHEFPTNFNARSPPPSSLSPTTNIRHPSSSPPRQKPEFGTAIIIPPSIPYKTHLLSRLNTIPQTPSHSTQSPIIQSPSSYAADLQIWERITVMEKPLPHLPWEWEPMKGEARKGSVVRVGEGYVDGNEEERVGCLGSRRLARLRRRFWANLRGGEK